MGHSYGMAKYNATLDINFFISHHLLLALVFMEMNSLCLSPS